MAGKEGRGTGLRARLRRFRRNDHLILWCLALVIGAGSGVAAIGFRESINLVQQLFFGYGGERLATIASWLPWWQVLLAPVVGGLVVGLLITYGGVPGRRPHAVADVIEASALHGGRLSLTVGLRAAVVSAISLGSGASTGREGPVVHLGASLGAWVSKRLHLRRQLSRTLLGCGVAAAIAASFNAPIAGTFFALEVVLGHYALPAFAPIVISAVTGTVISRMHYGDFPAFILPPDRGIASFWEFPAFALLGVVCAIAAIAFMRSVAYTQTVVERLPVPLWSLPAFGGLVVGAIALGFPEVLGVGYEATDAALSELYPLGILLALLVAKGVATTVSLACRFGGGVFSPSLFLGAMVGGAFGVIATQAFPELSSGHGAYTLIGMGALAGSVLGAPISTILMVFELSGDYKLTIAVMIATAVASLITQQLFGRSFFTWQLEQRGINIAGGRDVGLLRSIKVGNVMDQRYHTIPADLPLAEVRSRLQAAPWGELFVLGGESGRRLVGTVTFADLSDAAFDTSHDQDWTAAEVARADPTVLHAGDDLEAAVRVYGASGEAHLPVVDSDERMTLLGVAHEHELVLAYQRALSQVRAEEQGEL